MANFCVSQYRAKDAFPLYHLEVHALRAGLFPQQPKWTEMKLSHISDLWGQNAAPGVPCPLESDGLVKQPPLAEVRLLCFRQVYTQQAQLTVTLWGFKLDGLLITVA